LVSEHVLLGSGKLSLRVADGAVGILHLQELVSAQGGMLHGVAHVGPSDMVGFGLLKFGQLVVSVNCVAVVRTQEIYVHLLLVLTLVIDFDGLTAPVVQ
jgi:hypothetical protein